MRSWYLGVGPLAVMLLAVAGCGGGVSELGRDGGSGDDENPGDGGIVGTDGGPATNPKCLPTANVFEGNSCSVSGLVCPSIQGVLDCSGDVHTLSCFCDGNSWTCEQAAPPTCAEDSGPTQGPCPGPFTISNGVSCASPGQVCEAAITTYGCGDNPISTMQACTCTMFGWSCPPISEPPCVQPPPTACPSPYSVYSYGYCYNQQGQVCPGNPQNCGGEIYYDALECEGDWEPVATTTCAIYEGEDAATPFYGDAGYPYALDAAAVADKVIE
jgi:hypothetical protein